MMWAAVPPFFSAGWAYFSLVCALWPCDYHSTLGRKRCVRCQRHSVLSGWLEAWGTWTVTPLQYVAAALQNCNIVASTRCRILHLFFISNIMFMFTQHIYFQEWLASHFKTKFYRSSSWAAAAPVSPPDYHHGQAVFSAWRSANPLEHRKTVLKRFSL